jgi:hypothetical protein
MREIFFDEPLSFDEMNELIKVLEGRINAMVKTF